MGRAVSQAVCGDSALEFVAAVDPSYDSIDVGEVTGVSGCNFSVSSQSDALLHAQTQVAVDFTAPAAAKENLKFCAENGIHAVIGTSGFTAQDYDSIGEMFTTSNCLIAPNFAIGAVLMMRFAELAAPFFETGEVIEYHHNLKVDSPSGTAVNTAERIANASNSWAPDPIEEETITGARGAKGAGGVPVHSVRMMGMVAHQEVVFGTTGQTLTIRHDSIDRSSFMPGVLIAVKRVSELPGLTVGLDEALGL